MVNNLHAHRPLDSQATRIQSRKNTALSLLSRLISSFGGAQCSCCSALPSDTPSRLCNVCREYIEKQRLMMRSTCNICSLPLQPTATGSSEDQSNNQSTLFCGQCISSPPRFAHCVAAVRYSPVMARLVNRLKHQGRLSALRIMEQEIILALHSRQASTVDLLIPVPLHRKRLKSRGFNQSLELTKLISKSLDIPFARNICIRSKAGEAQQNLSKSRRFVNLQQTFEFTQQVEGLHLAIVDDVVTTTATARSITNAALAAGARRVDIWCFARTPAPD